MREIKTVIVELEYPRDDCLMDCSDEYYGIGRELIRCKDCKHWRSNGDFPRGEYCTRFQGSGYVWHSIPDDFCSLAEPTMSRHETGLSEERRRRMIK